MWQEKRSIELLPTENWTSFLATMARNYDFTYPEQVMIYAQRPNATLCKPYEEWNTDQYRRYVKRGSTGIALFVMNQDKPYLRYVFDVADTGVRRSSPSITPWRVTDENRRFIMDEMERVFQVPSEEFWNISWKISQSTLPESIGTISKSRSSTSLQIASLRSMMNITSR